MEFRRLDTEWETLVAHMRSAGYSDFYVWEMELTLRRLFEDAPSLAIRVTNAIKADALAQIVPTEMQFGNVTLGIAVIPANEEATDEQVWRWAFDGNPALAGTDVEALPDGSPATFALFAPECAQWFADDLTNPLGLQTKTYEQIARDVLVAGSVRITSDVID